jgi:NADPH2:quinone reductase
MKAVYIEVGGGPEVLRHGELPQPQCTRDTQVLVRIKAAGVNPIDTKLRAAPERFPLSMPAILGCDGAGVVEAVGDAVDGFQPGDEVYFSQPGFNRRQGSYAQYAVVDGSLLAPKPKSLSFIEAAAAPLVLITAWEALHDRAQVQAGHKVLIHAGAGGVGHVAIQLAKLAGASVCATVSTAEKAEFAQRLGADKSILYKEQDVHAEVLQWSNGEGVDIAFDTVGGKVLESCFPCVKLYGDVVTILQPEANMNWTLARQRNVRFAFELMLAPVMLEVEEAKRHQGEILQQCAQLIDDGLLRVVVAKTFALEEARQAHEFLQQQHPMGKVVLTLE